MANIELEGDSQQLIRLIQRWLDKHQYVGVIMADIPQFIDGFLSVSTCFV